ncbi:hypothetical protein H9P43_000641 [Blastocladiella emersonii ATCC 22665]|nr:hypothetical protein H9P43_000641 [Blastocladiella emersonii ATCC 22665]
MHADGSVDPVAGHVSYAVPADLASGSDYALRFNFDGQLTVSSKYSTTFPIAGADSKAASNDPTTEMLARVNSGAYAVHGSAGVVLVAAAAVGFLAM